MRIKKSLAGIAAAGLAISGIAVVTAPTANAFSGNLNLNCWVSGISSAPAPWPKGAAPQPGPIAHTLTINGSATGTISMNAGTTVDVEYSYAQGPTNGGPTIAPGLASTTATFEVLDENLDVVDTFDSATVTNSVSVAAGASGGIFPGETLVGQFTAPANGDYTLQVKNVLWSVPSFATDVFCNASTTNPETTPVAFASTAFNAVGPNAGITSITGQRAGVTGFARGGDVLNVSGTVWTGSSTIGSVTIGGVPATNTLSVTGDNISGTVTVPFGGATGATTLSIVAGPNSSTTSFVKLGSRTLSVSPAAAGPGTSVSISGSNWDPTAAIQVRGYTTLGSYTPQAGPPTIAPPTGSADAPIAITASASGTISASYVVNDPDTVLISGAETPPFGNPSQDFVAPTGTGPGNAIGVAGTLYASNFSVNADECTADPGTGTSTPCDTKQNVTATVVPGALTQSASSDGDRVRVFSSKADGAAGTYTGIATTPTLNTVTGDPTSGSGLTVDITRNASGAITSVSIADIGDGLYESNDLVEIAAGASGAGSTKVVVEVLRYSSTLIAFGSVVTSTAIQTLPGTINDVTVTDARGGNAGWSLTASLPSLTETGGGSISNEFVRIENISCAPQGTSAPGVAEGLDGDFSAANGPAATYPSGAGTVTLCNKLTGTANEANGGTTSGEYIVDAELFLDVPAFQRVGNYTSTMVITLA